MTRMELCPTLPRRDATHELRAAVADTLASSRCAELALVDCETSGDRVILWGEVPSYRLKQLAQSLAMRVAGVGRIENRLTVHPPEEWRDVDRRATP